VEAAAPENSAAGGKVLLQKISGEPFAAILGSFTAKIPPGDLAALILWGDGRKSNGKVACIGANASALRVSGKHTYLAPGTYRVQVRVSRSSMSRLGGQTLVATINRTVVATAPQAMPLVGTLSGTYSHLFVPGILGPAFGFKGAGNAGIMGGITISGTISLPNDLPSSDTVSGMLRLANSRGSVTLDVRAPFTSEMPLPAMFPYTVASGTGIYSGSTGAGELAATLNSTAGKVFTFVLS
jgi:hypothetical protein